MFSSFFICILVIGVSIAITWVGSDLLESSSTRLAQYYNLSPIFQGTIITAVGSSFPELASSVLSTLLHDKFDLGVSVIVGSAIFNILVIPALSGIIGGSLVCTINLVYRDTQFYLISVLVLIVCFALAVTYYPVEGTYLKGEVNRNLALIPMIFYGLYLFIQYQELRDHQRTHQPEVTSNIKAWKEWLNLTFSLAVIVIGVEGLIRSAIWLGDFFQTPSFLWGITVVAIGTSIPDTFVSVKVAIKQEGEISLGNVIGSNVFDLLVAIPVGILLTGSAIINFSVAAPLMGFLLVVTLVLFVILRIRLCLNRADCWLLLGIYLLFIAWMFTETYRLTQLLPL